jgi:carboxypeptidase Taq
MTPSSKTPRDAYKDLERRFERMNLVRDAASMLEWDAATYMPDGGADARADQLATLRVVRHEMLTDPAIGDVLARAGEAADLDPWERANLHEMRRERVHATAVPSALVEARSQATSACEMRWRSARRDDDFAGLLPLFEEVLKLTREVAAAKSSSLDVSPYDALLDEWEPGGRAADIDVVFAAIERFLPSLVERVIERQASLPILAPPVGPFPAERQRALADRVMRALGFDFAHGRLDVSAHPFCIGVPDDVRITTRWDEADFANGLFGVIHETGHALYERGLPKRWRKQPVGQARGMSTHESQSLLFEMQATRSPEFVGWLAGVAREVFGGSGPAWSAEALLQHVQRVKRSFIRIDADEVTYPLHVVLRFRLERALLSGDLPLKDLPGAFADGMQRLLGVRPSTHRDGSLQDIHWPSGTFGYFPTYTLGALTAAQLYGAAVKQAPAIPGALAKGDASPLTAWLVEHVHGLGSSIAPGEIVRRATGEPLSPEIFRRHLEHRYLAS